MKLVFTAAREFLFPQSISDSEIDGIQPIDCCGKAEEREDHTCHDTSLGARSLQFALNQSLLNLTLKNESQITRQHSSHT